jgi:hypothetical protein
MWKQLANPDVLVYLEVSYPETLVRRNLNWTKAEYDEQVNRLSHARENADILIQTDNLTVEEVCANIQNHLSEFPNA